MSLGGGFEIPSPLGGFLFLLHVSDLLRLTSFTSREFIGSVLVQFVQGKRAKSFLKSLQFCMHIFLIPFEINGDIRIYMRKPL